MAENIVELRNLVQHFGHGRFSGGQKVHALNGVSLDIQKGKTLGLVGETGSGKSTICRLLLRLYRPTSGEIIFNGLDISHRPERQLAAFRRQVQMIFQDPVDSLNPRFNTGAIIEEPLVIQKTCPPNDRKSKAIELLALVGLSEDAYLRYPHEFSGGQRQRIAIARSLALSPQVLVCDEPVSALDVSIQSQILNLLLDIQARLGLTMLFVSHNLAVVRHMSDRVAVLYLGSVMEVASSETIYRNPNHPYTRSLIASIPKSEPGSRHIEVPFKGDLPSSIKLPPGCPFHQNCPMRFEPCDRIKPVLKSIGPGHSSACHLNGID